MSTQAEPEAPARITAAAQAAVWAPAAAKAGAAGAPAG